MPKISNDQGLRERLHRLSIPEQRNLAGRFVNHVADLAQDPVLRDAIQSALEAEISESGRSHAYKTAKSIAVKTYTSCGRDADWLAQAEHFVAVACAAALTPEDAVGEQTNLAWKAAMQARVARNCAMIESDASDEISEIEAQYRLTEEFLAQ